MCVCVREREIERERKKGCIDVCWSLSRISLFECLEILVEVVNRFLIIFLWVLDECIFSG